MKKTWNTPKLTVHGAVKEITQAKSIGPSDGFFLINTNVNPPTIDPASGTL